MSEIKNKLFVSDNAKLLAEWDYEKNESILPSQVTLNSNRKMWWKCKKGHQWQAVVSSRNKGRNCPICANQVILSGYNDLATLNSDLASEWHPTKNGNLTPTDVSVGSNRKVWWKCQNEHEWQASIGNRNNGNRCPYCSNKKILIGFNDLATLNPNLASEWHPTLNGNLTPQMVSLKSNKKIWWRGKCGHEWKSLVSVRSSGNGCPYCSNHKLLTGFNDLSTVNTELSKEWNFQKNGILLPTQVLYNSNKKVWWKCRYGHEWQAIVISRNNGSGCPVCNQRNKTSFPEQCIYYYLKKLFPDSLNRDMKALQGKMELDIFIPSIMTGIEYDGSYWHTKKNLKREEKKYELCKSNNIRLIRIREKLDSEKSLICDDLLMINSPITFEQLNTLIFNLLELLKVDIHPDINCKRDRSLILSFYLSALNENSLKAFNSVLAEEWHPTKNGKLTPDMFTVSSGEQVWWLGKCNHEWKATIANRNKGIGCPYCSGQKRIIGENDFETLYQELSDEWHPIKNFALNPKNLGPKSNILVWWIGKCGHEWKARIADRTSGQGCPFCSNHQILEGYNDLFTLNPILSEEWHYQKNGLLRPTMVTHKSNKKVWWLGKCGHEWEATINDRSNGSRCPYCANRKILIGFNDLATQNPNLAAEWHPTKNGKLTARMVTAKCGKKVWWLGKCGHEWETRIIHRTNGSGCPYCCRKKR